MSAPQWTEALAVSVTPLADGASCADQDGDGALHAADCPGAPPEQLDCDDADPAVNPSTERWVTPGPFVMGSNSEEAGADEGPLHVVTLSGYCLDRDEVTAGQFAAWLQQTNQRPRSADIRNVDAQGQVISGREQHPVEGVTWEEAQSFCRAQGKELPTEAQWEKAARGGCELGDDAQRCDPSDLRQFPWGSAAPDCQRANHQRTTGGMPTLCTADTLPVGSLPAGHGPYGHRDLAGNVWEYVRDGYHPAVYTADGVREDPGGPEGAAYHVMRGGSWSTFSTNMRVANRHNELVMGSATGFRCARYTATPNMDQTPALEVVTLSGVLSFGAGDNGQPKPLSGRALYVTAFDVADLDGGGMPIPGRSPAAEIRFSPTGELQAPFALPVPKGGTYVLQASLDDGSEDGPLPASGSGGVGAIDAPVVADADREGLQITLRPLPVGGPRR